MPDLAELHRVVWVKRHELAELWPIPPTDDALAFASCEAHELLDAWLRINRPQYNRNHVKSADVRGEAADTAIMLMTAIGPEPLGRWGLSDFQLSAAEADIRSVTHHCSMAQETYRRWEQQHTYARKAYCDWAVLALLELFLLEPELLTLVKQRLARIEQRVYSGSWRC